MLPAKHQGTPQEKEEAAAKAAEANEGEEEVEEESDEGQGGGLRRQDKGNSRFAAAEAAGGGAEAQEADQFEMSRTLCKDPSAIPWTPTRVRVEKEEGVLFRLGLSAKKKLAAARDEMREQGLYVARDKVLLPSNMERAIQRVRQRKQLVKARDGGAAATVAVQMEQDGSLEAEEEASAFLMPFDPLKERVCRPSARYDPSLPHMQYDHVVPVTNIDAVLGTAEAAALLDLDISHVTITGAPRCPRPAAPVSGLTPTPRVPRPPALVAGGFDGGGVGVALAQVPAARRDQLGRVLLGEAALCSCGPRHAQARA
jgi:hypothetical protein